MQTLATLVNSAKSGDRTAFETLVSRFTDYAHRRAFAVLGDYHLAQDATQDAFAEAFLNLDKLREPAAFPGWFRRILIKRIDRLIRKKRIPTVALYEGIAIAGESADWTADENELRETLELALNGLPDHEREVARRFYFMDESQRDIANDFHVPVSTIKKRLYSSRQRLRRHLGNREIFEETASPELSLADQLFSAARNGYASRAEAILREHFDLIHIVNEDRLGILLYAIHSAHYARNTAVVDVLLAAGAQLDLYSAAALGLTDYVKRNLDARTSVDLPGPWARTLLHWAASGGHTPLVKWLLEHGATPNARDRWGCTPLHLAAELGHIDSVSLLLRYGADVRARLKNGKTVMHLAAQSGNDAVLKHLVRQGVAIDVFSAASLGSNEAVHILLGRDPDQIHAKLPFGATALHMAAESGHRDTAEYLVEQGAELDLVCAAELGWLDEVAELLAAAPHLVREKAGSFGFTALHAATSKGRRDLARLLIAKGAPVNATDDMYDKTPLGEALYFGNESMARLLYGAGARS
ncbi:MAG: sigma-70 family RNA polymerase sigma factor [Candidatus Hydrogenedentes bacterium]|nr:sigma-70 family RNA polymerase sigma factor [Candidatus Hydrogenedentota bacterium]